MTIPRAAKSEVGCRVYDKSYSCFFCEKETAKIPRHFKTHHKDEPEVMRIEAMDNKKVRQLELDRFRLKGDFYHNLKVLKCGGELKVLRRPSVSETISYKQFVPCPHCLGFLQKHELWRHVSKCPFNETRSSEDGAQHRKLQFESEMLLYGSTDSSTAAFRDSVLAVMRHDDISFVAKRDELIIKVGAMLFEKDGSAKATNITQCMRSLARLLIEARNVIGSESADLATLITPSHFDDIVLATKQLCSHKVMESNDHLSSFQRPSLALKLGHYLKKCAGILRGVALRKKRSDLKQDVDAFAELLDAEWSSKISTTALRTLSDGQFKKTPVLPVTADLLKLREHCLAEIQIKGKKLIESPNLETWRQLAELTVTRIITLNKRRGNEGAKVEIVQFTDRPKWNEISMEEMTRSLKPLELQLCKR